MDPTLARSGATFDTAIEAEPPFGWLNRSSQLGASW
jgi:hypothetical protein